MERFNAASTSGMDVETFIESMAEWTTAETTAPVGRTKPSSTALRYLGSTRRSVAAPTPMETYAIMAARTGHGNNCEMNRVRPLITTAAKMTGVHTAKPILAPIAL